LFFIIRGNPKNAGFALSLILGNSKYLLNFLNSFLKLIKFSLLFILKDSILFNCSIPNAA